MPAKRRPKKSAAETTAEIVETVDDKKVEEAVTKINHILQDTLFRGVTAVGDYVLHVFFHDDPALVRSRDPNKAASFRALTDRCGDDLQISKSWLHNAVGVAILRRALPEGASYKQLSPSHQAILVPLRNAQAVEKFAKRAADKNLSVRQLKQIVVEEVAKSRSADESPRGRPSTPTIRKMLDRAELAFKLDDGKRVNKSMVEELGEDGVAQAIKDARGLIARLEALVQKLDAGA